MKRIKTGNWRPFRPAGMSDGTWQTILLLHRFPNDEMDEEEQSHCLGPKLFGKGGARFGDYGRGWIQEEADRLLNEGKTPYAMDAREWHDEIVAAIDYYNGETFAEAKENGDAQGDADFFAANMPWTGGNSMDNAAVEKYFAAKELAASRIEDIWHRICYGPFGVGPWHVLTKGVVDGWRDEFECPKNGAFTDVADTDWRCAVLGEDEMDVRLMTEICPICPNTTIMGGIERALDLAMEEKFEVVSKKKVTRYLKRALGELYKRRNAAQIDSDADLMDLTAFDLWMRRREERAVSRLGEEVVPDNRVEESSLSRIESMDVDEIRRQGEQKIADIRARWKAVRELVHKKIREGQPPLEE